MQNNYPSSSKYKGHLQQCCLYGMVIQTDVSCVWLLIVIAFPKLDNLLKV